MVEAFLVNFSRQGIGIGGRSPVTKIYWGLQREKVLCTCPRMFSFIVVALKTKTETWLRLKFEFEKSYIPVVEISITSCHKLCSNLRNMVNAGIIACDQSLGTVCPAGANNNEKYLASYWVSNYCWAF